MRSGGRFPADQVEELPVTGDGVVDLDALRRAIARAEHPLVSVMLANNETGVIQPIAAIAEIVHAADGLLHVDAVQGPAASIAGSAELGADLLSLSAHKLGGPQGAGALIRRGDIHIAEPLIKGGGQERGLRAGTENVAAIAGFGAAAAADAARQADAQRMAALRDRLEAGLKAATPDAMIFGAGADAAAQYEPVHGSRAEGGDGNNRLRSQWDSSIVRLRLFVRQGAALARAGGDGRGTGACARRGARQPRLDDHRSRHRKAAKCLE